MKSIERKLERLATLDQEIVDDIKAAYPVGSDVHWLHGSYWRSGVILGYGAAWSVDHLRFKVRTPSGREVWIGATRVIGDNSEEVPSCK